MLRPIIIFPLTVFYMVMLGLSYLSLERARVDEKLSYELVDEDPDRNEQSTPRSFVLPATPAVAFAQEKKSSDDVIRAALVERCLVALRAFGFEIIRDAEQFNVPLIKATLTIQRQVGIPETGKLDDTTMAYLGCLNDQ
jgi:hypothetical protein